MHPEQAVSGPVSQAALARMLGVSDTAVRKAIAKGRIRRRPDGLIDADEALADWRRNAGQPRRAGVPKINETIPESQESDALPPLSGPTIADRQCASLTMRPVRRRAWLSVRKVISACGERWGEAVA